MKLYSVMSVLAFGAFCYIIVEIRQLRKVSSPKLSNETIHNENFIAGAEAERVRT